jgi:hypothetical protein
MLAHDARCRPAKAHTRLTTPCSCCTACRSTARMPLCPHPLPRALAILPPLLRLRPRLTQLVPRHLKPFRQPVTQETTWARPAAARTLLQRIAIWLLGIPAAQSLRLTLHCLGPPLRASCTRRRASLQPNAAARRARWGPIHRCSFRSLSRLRQLKSMDTQCVEHEHPSRHAKLSSLRGVTRFGEMAWRMGHAIRDAAHAIMPRMRLVCGVNHNLTATRKRRLECYVVSSPQ